MPCMAVFNRQSAAYKEEIFSTACRKTFAMEAGVGAYWHQYTGLDSKILSIEKFGMSAPGNKDFEEFGMTAKNLIKECKAYM